MLDERIVGDVRQDAAVLGQQQEVTRVYVDQDGSAVIQRVGLQRNVS
jgi:hypothetical protein